MDHWDPDWPEAAKRAAIAGSAAWHRIKGTRQSVEIALAESGYPDAVVIEDRDLPRYGPDVIYDSGIVYGPGDASWADYWIETGSPVLYPEADRIAARLADTAPARCRLRAITITAPGAITYGAAGAVYGPDRTFGSVYHYGASHG